MRSGTGATIPYLSSETREIGCGDFQLQQQFPDYGLTVPIRVVDERNRVLMFSQISHRDALKSQDRLQFVENLMKITMLDWAHKVTSPELVVVSLIGTKMAFYKMDIVTEVVLDAFGKEVQSGKLAILKIKINVS